MPRCAVPSVDGRIGPGPNGMHDRRSTTGARHAVVQLARPAAAAPPRRRASASRAAEPFLARRGPGRRHRRTAPEGPRRAHDDHPPGRGLRRRAPGVTVAAWPVQELNSYGRRQPRRAEAGARCRGRHGWRRRAARQAAGRTHSSQVTRGLQARTPTAPTPTPPPDAASGPATGHPRQDGTSQAPPGAAAARRFPQLAFSRRTRAPRPRPRP